MPPPYTLCTKNSAEKKEESTLPTLPCAMVFLRFVQGTRINRKPRIGFSAGTATKRASSESEILGKLEHGIETERGGPSIKSPNLYSFCRGLEATVFFPQ
jgi:hypothetical protein